MPQSLHYLYAHLIFSTKGRKPWMTVDIRPKVWAYMSGVLQNHGCQSITIGGVDDHIHIVSNLTKKLEPMKLIEYLKRDSSKFVKTLDYRLQGFTWQGGYALLSLSPSHVPKAIQYVLNQEEHHRKETFQEELIRLLKKYSIEYDDRYLWD